MHLVSFLGHYKVAQRLINEKRVSLDVSNDFNCLPRDVAQTNAMARLVSGSSTKIDKKHGGVKLQYSSADRFKQLRQLAESSAPLKSQNSTRQAEGRYFRAGHVAESKRKVLSEEEAELEKQRARRQQEVAMLAKRSAVKSNPLFKKFEQQQQHHELKAKRSVSENNLRLQEEQSNNSNKASSDSQTTEGEEDEVENKPKRNSKVISSLRSKTYVSSSVFRQGEEKCPRRSLSSSAIAMKSREYLDDFGDSGSNPRDGSFAMDPVEATSMHLKQHVEKRQLDDPPERKEETSEPAEEDTTPTMIPNQINLESIPMLRESPVCVEQSLSNEQADSIDKRRLSGSQKAQWAIGMNSWYMLNRDKHDTIPSGDEDDGTSDAEEEKEQEKRLVDSQYHSPKRKYRDADENKHLMQQSPSTGSQTSADSDEPREQVSGEITVYFQSSTSSIPCIINVPQPTLTVEKAQEDSQRECQQTENYEVEPVQSDGKSIFVSSTSRVVRNLPHTQTPEIKPRPVIKKNPVPTTLLSEEQTRQLQQLQTKAFQSVPVSLPQAEKRYGKLYFRVNGLHDVLLPMSKEVTYVRCVVSDERYEYMSKYEVLGQHVHFDYECLVDTRPDMIVTVTIHVRPDFHLRLKKPISRLFRQRKNSLSGYIYPEDGSIGSARFALSHMLNGCYERPYAASFDCFNAWTKSRYGGSSKEEATLKVIGSLDVEMLYLPVDDPSLVSLANLRCALCCCGLT